MESAILAMQSPVEQLPELSLEEALALLERMPHPPSVQNLTCILHKCRKHKNPTYTLRLHTYLCKSGLEAHKSLGNHLVPMLVEVGSMSDAQQVFDRLLDRNVHSWTSLIAGYIECGEVQHAFVLHQKMQEDALHPNGYTFVALLKACARLKDTERGRELHAEIERNGLLENDPFVGNTLVDMYAKCGLLAKAREVFDKLLFRNAVSWNALIAGYTQHNLAQDALDCFEQMQLEGVSPTSVTFVCSLKACGSIGAIDKGREIHAHIATKGSDNLFVGNTLVDMYAKCGLLAKALEVFDKLPVRNAVSWNALIAGYVEHNLGQDALNCLEQMQLEGISPDVVTFVCSLKACGSIGAIDKVQDIHAQIAQKGLLERDISVGNTLVDTYAKCGLIAKAEEVLEKLPFQNVILWTALVDMYAKCGLLVKAQEVFDKLPIRDAVLWTALIAGYSENNRGQDALKCFEQMQLEGISPDAATFVCSLKACGSIGAGDKGREIHAQLAGPLERDSFVGSTLVDMYAKCGLLAKAQEVFDKILIRDVVVWTALIAGYAEHDLSQDALYCFQQLQLEGITPDAATFVCSMKACGSIGAIDKVQEIHDHVATKGLLEGDRFVGNTLIDMYAKCGLLTKALEVFDKLPVRDAVSWTALITGYAEHNLGQDALNCFEQMQLEGISPNAVTFVCSLKACGSIGAIHKGREIHAQLATKGLLEREPFVASTLIDMYATCGLLAVAQEVFDKLPFRDAVMWTALIAGYAEDNLGQDALNCFEQMQLEGITPDAVTFDCSLKACGSIGAIDKGQEIHGYIVTEGLLEGDRLVGNTLIDMYAQFGLLAKAQEVFDNLPVRDAVSWTAIIAGYAEHNLGQDALNCFEQMQLEGITPYAVTFICSLKACGSIGAIHKGREIHAQIATKGLLERDLFVGNTLVDMYAKCGLLAKAQEVFDKLPVRNAVSWNALIAGYARLGESEDVFVLLDRMRAEDRVPDGVTFLSILTVCSHTGLVEKGQIYFEAMNKDYGITPTIEHHNCMVDLLGRAGQLDKAVVMIEKMTFNPDLSSWHTLLGACRKWRNVELGRWAFEHAVEVDKNDAAAYVLMSSIYADARMQEDAKQVELMRLKENAWKMPGQSWTEGGGIVHSYLVGDTRHFKSHSIDAKLEDRSFIREEGYAPDLQWLYKHITDDLKESELCWLSCGP